MCFSSVHLFQVYIHKIYMFTIKKIIQNTVKKDLSNGWGCKNQQNFDNRKIFVCVMEELPT